MKIIVIGMDNTGKTTLCNKLSEELNIRHIKSEGPSISFETMKRLIRERLFAPEDLILERFSFFEELIYGPVLRGGSKFKFSDMEYVYLKAENPVIIYCKPSKFKIGDKEEMDGVIENADNLNKRWRKLIRKLKEDHFTVLTYNYQQDPEAKELLNALREL